MKVHQSLLAVLPACLTTLALLVASPARAALHTLQFTTGASNAALNANAVTLDSPLLNGKASAKLIITPYFPGPYSSNFSSVTDPHPTGVRYTPGATAAAGRWEIFNEDNVAMPSGTVFNVLVSTSTTQLDSTVLNSLGDYTVVPTAKGKPAAILLFTHMWDPLYKSGSGISVPIQAISYLGTQPAGNPFSNKWSIYNQSGQSAAAARYFVLDTASIPASAGAVKLVHTSSAQNDSQYITAIDEAGAISVTAGGMIFVVPLNVTNSAPVAISYNLDVNAKWVILNSNGTYFTPGQTFNVLMFPNPIP